MNENIDKLLKLIATARIAGPNRKDYLTIVANNTLFLSKERIINNLPDIKGFSLDNGNILSQEETVDRYVKHIQGKTALGKGLTVNIPVSYDSIKCKDVGKYRIFLFVNEIRRENAKVHGSQSVLLIKSMSAVVIVDMEKSKVVYSAFEISPAHHLVFESFNNAVWAVNKANNSADIVVVHPNHIETRKIYPHIMLLPQEFKSSMWNLDKHTSVSSSQYGIFVEDKDIAGFLTVINGKITLLGIHGKQLSKVYQKEEKGFIITQIEPFIISDKSYMFYIKMSKKKIHNLPMNVARMIVKSNIDKYIDKDSLVSSSLLAQNGTKQIFLLIKMNKETRDYYTEIVYIDSSKDVVRLLRKTSEFLPIARAYIGSRHFWVLIERYVEEDEHKLIHTKTVSIYDVNTAHKVDEKVIKNFDGYFSIPINNQDRKYICIVKKSDKVKITVFNTETLQEQIHDLPVDVPYASGLRVICIDDDFLIGSWAYSMQEYKSPTEGVAYRKGNGYFSLDCIVHSNKVYSFKPALIINNPYVFLKEHNLAKVSQEEEER